MPVQYAGTENVPIRQVPRDIENFNHLSSTISANEAPQDLQKYVRALLGENKKLAAALERTKQEKQDQLNSIASFHQTSEIHIQRCHELEERTWI